MTLNRYPHSFLSFQFIEKNLPLLPPLKIYFPCMYKYVCWLLKPSKKKISPRQVRQSFGLRIVHPALFPSVLRPIAVLAITTLSLGKLNATTPNIRLKKSVSR